MLPPTGEQITMSSGWHLWASPPTKGHLTPHSPWLLQGPPSPGSPPTAGVPQLVVGLWSLPTLMTGPWSSDSQCSATCSCEFYSSACTQKHVHTVGRESVQCGRVPGTSTQRRNRACRHRSLPRPPPGTAR